MMHNPVTNPLIGPAALDFKQTNLGNGVYKFEYTVVAPGTYNISANLDGVYPILYSPFVCLCTPTNNPWTNSRTNPSPTPPPSITAIASLTTVSGDAFEYEELDISEYYEIIVQLHGAGGVAKNEGDTVTFTVSVGYPFDDSTVDNGDGTYTLSFGNDLWCLNRQSEGWEKEGEKRVDYKYFQKRWIRKLFWIFKYLSRDLLNIFVEASLIPVIDDWVCRELSLSISMVRCIMIFFS